MDEQDAEELYEHAPCGYLTTSPDGTIANVNQTFLSWTGHARDELVGRRRFPDLLTAGGRIYHETHYAPLLRMQGAVREIALEVVRADGSRLPVLVNSDLKRDADGQPALIRTTVFNATDRKEYERELMRVRDRERAARERTERLARITAVLAGALDRRAIAAAVVAELAQSVAAETAAFALAGEQSELELVASHGPDPGIGEAAAAAALRSREPSFHDAPESGTLAVLPLVADGQALGVLWLRLTGDRRLSDHDRAFLEAAAGQCAQALDRVRLHEETARAARGWAFLAEASRVLDEAEGTVRRAQRLVDLVVARMADGASVEIIDEEGRTKLAVAARDPALRERHAGAGARLDAAVEEAIATGEPRILHGPAGDRRSGERAAPLHFAALPLRARGRVLGALTLTSFEPELRFGAEDGPFLSGLADRAALALENARLYEQQRAVAETLQHSLLAGEPPRDPRFEVATKYRPAVATLEVGGDWYDTFSVADGTIGIVVGDVVGRGVEAASAMGQLRSAVRALAGAKLGPAQLIAHLDAFVERVETARYATLAYAEIELDSGRMRFACAGHPPPLLAEPGAPARLLWEGRSTPLGAFAGLPPRTEAALTLEPGARLLLYTDGLFERRNRPLDEGLDRLAQEFERRGEAPLATLIEELTAAMLVDEQGHDDVCLLCLSLRFADAPDAPHEVVDHGVVDPEAGEPGKPGEREVADDGEQLLVAERAARTAGLV